MYIDICDRQKLTRNFSDFSSRMLSNAVLLNVERAIISFRDCRLQRTEIKACSLLCTYTFPTQRLTRRVDE